MFPKITEEDVITLKKYKYQSTPNTPLDRLLEPFWTYCTKLLPEWMAPNLVTLTGFAFAILGTIVLTAASRDMTSTIPSWALLLHGLCVFIYQTFDCIDGRQARRTNSSSILGQLFDHGCDSFLMPHFAMGIMQALRKGSGLWPLTWMISCLYYFFLLTWEEYNIGIFPITSGWVGATECKILISHLLSITCVVNRSNIWARKNYHSIYKCKLGQDDSLFIRGNWDLLFLIYDIFIYTPSNYAY